MKNDVERKNKRAWRNLDGHRILCKFPDDVNAEIGWIRDPNAGELR